MPITFPSDSTGKAGTIKINADGNSFHIPIVLYGPDGITPISSTQRLPVDSLPAGSPTLKGALQDVAAAGTRVQLPALACREVTIIAKDTNTGNIFVGGSDVTATVYGAKLKADGSITLAVNNTNLIFDSPRPALYRDIGDTLPADRCVNVSINKWRCVTDKRGHL